MANVSLTKVKSLTTSAEYDLVKASRRPEIGQLDARALKKHVTQARKLRDKWRDQATKQRRDTHERHNARVADGEKRSEEKVEIFDATLAAFQKQLEKVSAEGGASSRGPAKKKPTKSAKAPDHRAERASKRESLEAQREEMNAAGSEPETWQTTRKKVVKKKTAKKATASSGGPKKKAAKKKSAKKAAKKKAVKKTTAKKGAYAARAKKAVKKKLDKGAAASTDNQGSQSKGLVGPIVEKKQIRAETAIKQGRVDRSGLRSRVKGHVSARGRRAQGKRDSRS